MEPISVVLAGVVTTIVLPKILEKANEKIVDAALEKSSELFQLVYKTVRDKFQSSGKIGLLERVEGKPTEQNIQVFEGELVNQMEEDKEFVAQLEKLIQQIQAQSPSLQVVLDKVRVKGSAKIGNIGQASEGKSAEQVVGRDLDIGGDLEIGDVIQKQKS